MNLCIIKGFFKNLTLTESSELRAAAAPGSSGGGGEFGLSSLSFYRPSSVAHYTATVLYSALWPLMMQHYPGCYTKTSLSCSNGKTFSSKE